MEGKSLNSYNDITEYQMAHEEFLQENYELLEHVMMISGSNVNDIEDSDEYSRRLGGE